MDPRFESQSTSIQKYQEPIHLQISLSPEIVPGSPKSSPKGFLISTPQTAENVAIIKSCKPPCNSLETALSSCSNNDATNFNKADCSSPLDNQSSYEENIAIPKFHLGPRKCFPYEIKRTEEMIRYVRCNVIKTVCSVKLSNGNKAEKEFYDIIKPINFAYHSGSLADESSSLSKSSEDGSSLEFSGNKTTKLYHGLSCVNSKIQSDNSNSYKHSTGTIYEEMLETASNEEDNLTDSKTTVIRNICEGDEVFARWKDDKFYPAYVKQVIEGKILKAKVSYFDGNLRTLPTCDVVKLNIIPPGSSAFVLIDEDYFLGNITAISRQNNETVYKVSLENDSAIAEANFDDLMLSYEQVQKLTGFSSSPSKDMSKTNGHPSPKVSSETKCTAVLEAPSTSKVAAVTRKRRFVYLSSADSDSSDKQLKVPRKRGRPKKSASVLVKSGKYLPITGKLPNTTAVKDVMTSGNLFVGIGFVFTRVENLSDDVRKAVEMDKYFAGFQTCSSSDRDSSDQDLSDVAILLSELPSAHGFDKPDVMNMVISEGGTVFDSIEELKQFSGDKYLITNGICRSAKFIRAVAANIPCLHFKWVEQSIKERRCLNPIQFNLPFGLSIGTPELVHERANPEPFVGCAFYIHLPDYNLYCDISVDAGAIIVEDVLQANYVLTDSSCPKEIIETASKYNISLVSVVWLVDCIIRGELIRESSNLRYKYDVEAMF